MMPMLAVLLAAHGARAAPGTAGAPLVEWSLREVTVGLDASYERDPGFERSALEPKLSWSLLQASLLRSRFGCETEVSYADERAVLEHATGRTRTFGWNLAKVDVRRLAGVPLESYHVVPFVSVGIERARVETAEETSRATAWSWGAGVEVEVAGGVGLSFGYRRAWPAGELRHTEATVGLTYSFGKPPEDDDG